LAFGEGISGRPRLTLPLLVLLLLLLPASENSSKIHQGGRREIAEGVKSSRREKGGLDRWGSLPMKEAGGLGSEGRSRSSLLGSPMVLL